ncbi:MAG TPA: YicC/YloC family endoribonuclease [Granulicella sp.]
MKPILSMTGFASLSSPSEQQGAAFTLTLKSVNHRFLDLSLRLPSQCDELEGSLRRMVKETVRRGHVDLTLQMERGETNSALRLTLNQELLAAHVAAFREAAAKYGTSAVPDMNTILYLPGVLRSETAAITTDDAATFHANVLALLPALLERFNEVRAQEGASLALEMRAAMLRLEALAAEVSALREDVRSAYAERIRSRIAELLESMGVAKGSIAEDRILSEAALLAERSDIDEELVRLQTHVTRFLALLDEGGELGKRLDFLLQELNREANTLLSKTSGATSGNGLRVTELGLEMKLEIEKAREQVQNLE